MSPWNVYRTVVEDTAAQEAADSFSDEHPRIGEAWEGLKWLLCRTPEIGDPNGGGQYLYIQAGDELAGTPIIAVVYSFTSEEVVIHGAKTFRVPADDEAV
jgi:hypothetical protein